MKTKWNYEQMHALFPAGTVPPGLYTVRVTRNGTMAERAGALEIVEGGIAKLEIDLILPARFGYHQLATVYVEYKNTGDAPMAAPLLLVSATQNGRAGAIITLNQDRISKGFWTSAMPEGFANSVQFLASGEMAGILQPGETRRMPIYYAGWQIPFDLSYPPFEWTVGVLDERNETEINWPDMKDGLRPDYMRPDAWEVVWENFIALAGTTWGDYIAMLSRNALYLHRQGQRVDEIEALLALSFRLADGMNPLATLAEGVDMVVAGSGLSIIFERAHLQYISRRFETGALGRGWTHNWRVGLTVREDGTVEIADQTGTPRVFQPDSRYSGRYLGRPGDEGDLRDVASGYRLTEANGGILMFAANGDLLYIEEPNGNRITAEYTAGRLTRLTHSTGGFLLFGYNDAERIETVTDQHGRQTQYAYTGEYLTRVTCPDGRSVDYAYETAAGPSQHALRSIRFPNGSTRHYVYDVIGRLHETYRDDQRERTAFAYADNGRILVTDALANASRLYYDHWGRLVKAENPLGEAVRMIFDELGNLVAVTDPEGATVSLEYDRRGNLVEITDAMRHVTRFSYTKAMNRLAGVTDARNNRTEFAYDDHGNLTAMNYPDGSREEWGYDAPGNPICWTNRRGTPVDFDYDAAGRITGKTFADGATVAYAYDARGNLIEAVDARGTHTLTYSATDYLTRIAYPGDRWLEFTYDAAGRRATSRDQIGYQVDYHYDDGGRLARLSDPNGDLVQYAYDVLGRLARKTLGNGVYAVHAYDAAGRLLSLVNHHPDDSVLSSFAYTYDRRGRRTAMATHYGQWSYTYDDAGQLVRAVLDSASPAIPSQDLAYEYDPLGNRIRTTVNGIEEEYDANNLNQYTTVGERNYTYDLDGNLIREDGPDGITIYTYNDDNRLVGVTRGIDAWEYRYDPFGNRVAVDENGVRIHYVIDPVGFGNVVGGYDDGGNPLGRYAHGLGLVSRTDGAGATAFYTSDPNGSVSELTNPAGVALNRYAYRPFGETQRLAAAIPNPFEFAGQWGVMADAGTLHHMRARAYDPRSGRFTTVDPIRFGADLNLYRYGVNDPVSFVDVNGLWAIQLSGWLGFKFAGGGTITFGDCGIRVAPRAGGGFGGAGSVTFTESPTQSGFDANVLVALETGAMGYESSVGYGSGGRRSSVTGSVGLFVGGASSEGSEMSGQGGFGKGLGAMAGGEVGYTYAWCAPSTQPPSVNPDAGDFTGGTGATAGSKDPNEKISVTGFGPANYVKAERTLSYRIDFENYESATAPAQVVTIRDPLSEDLDWTTFEIAEIGFGEVIVPVPAGRNYFQTVVDYAYTDDDYDFDIEVHIEAWLENGVFCVNFLSIDPETGLPPGVDIGFLPPETDSATGRGRGFASYLIRPKAGLPSGASIRNIATIQFDFGLEIDTNQVDPLDKLQGTDPAKEALVTFDNLPPASRVGPLPVITWTAAFPVAWSGEDDELGGGIRSYDVFVRQNDGPWNLWLADAGQIAAIYPGEHGNTYSFHCLATDQVGNRESKPETAEAVTRVVVGTVMWIAVDAGDGTSLGLEFGEAATATAQIDPLDILAEAGQLAHLLCPWVPDPAGQPMTRDIRPIPDDGLTRWRLEVGELVTRDQRPATRGTVTLTWNVEAGAAGREVWLQRLDAFEYPVGFPVDMKTPGELAGVAPGTVFEIVYGALQTHEIELRRGWNAVGTPLTTLAGLGELAEPTSGRQEATIPFPAWKRVGGRFERVEGDDAFCPEAAHWVYCTAEQGQRLEVRGLPPDGWVRLAPGWNFVSPVKDLQLNAGRGIAAPAWEWRPDTGAYRPLLQGETLEVGHAYWIFADEATPMSLVP